MHLMDVTMLKVIRSVSTYKGKSCIVTQCYADLKDFLPLLEKLDLDPNPRNPSRTPIVIDIIKTLEESPYLYPALSRGLIISCSVSQYHTGGNLEVKINKDEYFAQGILDGAHNALALLSFVTGRKPKSWDEAKAFYREHGVREELSKVMIPLSFISPNPECTLSHEQIKADLDKIKETRNSSVSVPKSALAANRGTLDIIKEALSPRLNQRIAWVSDKSITGQLNVQLVANLLIYPLHVLPNDHPVSASLCPPHSIVKEPGKTFATVEKILKDYADDDLVMSCVQHIESIALLFDHVQKHFLDHYNKTGRRFTQKASRTKPKSLYFQDPLHKKIKSGLVHPIVYAVVFGALYIEDGEMKSMGDLCSVFDQVISDNIEEIAHLFEDCRRDEKAFGINRLVYSSLSRSILKDCKRLRALASS